jgi:hypothetical protein
VRVRSLSRRMRGNGDGGAAVGEAAPLLLPVS